MADLAANAQVHERPLMRAILFVIVGLLFAAPLEAQVFKEDASRKAQRHFDKSNQDFRAANFKAAIEHLETAIEAEPKFVDALLRVGDLYYRQGQYEKAVSRLSKGLELAPEYHYFSYNLLAKAHLKLDQFEEAKAAYEQFLQDPNLPESQRQQVRQKIDNTLFAAEARKDTAPFDPTNLGPSVNTPMHEYLPTLTASEDVLYFTRREGQLEDIWVSQKKDTAWGKAKNLGKPINTPQFGEGSQAISPDGKTLYFATNWGDGEKVRGWDIYEANRTENGWTDPEMLPTPINTLSYESQPCVSADGKLLFFSSRRDGGEGGKDIWVCERQEDCSWGEPKNLGATINTEGDEEVPFIHPDGQTLYFGSTGHPGMGQSDLYLSRRQEDGSWGEPQNLGYPLNTEANEAALFIATKGNYGYFASDKLEGYGGYDLYRFDLWEEIKPEPIGFVMIRIFDKDTREQLDADFEMVDLETEEEILNSKCNDYLKNYFFLPLPLYKEYALHVNRPGYLFHSANFQLTKADKFQIREVDIYLEKIRKGGKLVMENVFFDTDSFTLKQKSKPELNQLAQLLKDNPYLKIEIGGHTDSTGSSAYNQQLSEKRAKSVYEYLIEKDITSSRLSYKGYGESEPIATNQTEEGKTKNRRTEVKVVGK